MCVNRGLVTHCATRMCSPPGSGSETGVGVRTADVRLPLPRAPEPTLIGYSGTRDWLLRGRSVFNLHIQPFLLSVSEVCWFSSPTPLRLLLQYRIPDARRRGINITSIFGLVPQAFFFFSFLQGQRLALR